MNQFMAFAKLCIFLLHKNSICFASETMVPSTIPPERYCENQFITRGKYTITTVFSENGPPPSELKLARRIGFAPLQLNLQSTRQRSETYHLPFEICNLYIIRRFAPRNFEFCILNFAFSLLPIIHLMR